jgi:hypothetical protein
MIHQFSERNVLGGRLTVETDITHRWKGFVRVGHEVDTGSGHRLVAEATQEIDLRFFRLRGCRLRRTNRRTN